MTFETIKDKALLKRLNELDMLSETAIQKDMIPKAIEGADILATSKTGSGKTLAFLLPVLSKLTFEANDPSVLILVPTRELALQIEAVIRDVALYKRIKPVCLIGEMQFHAQALELNQKSHIIVGTPGRVLDHFEKETIQADTIDTLIIDEVDHLFDRGFLDQIEAILPFLRENRQNIYTSATLPEDLMPFIEDTLQAYEYIHVDESHEGIFTQKVVDVTTESKEDLLVRILVGEGELEAIVFCEEKRTVDYIADELDREGFPIVRLHGDLKQSTRNQAIRQFKEKSRPILITTNLMARGMDLRGLPLVINYDLAYTEEVFKHRMGRTGRMDQKGTVVHLLMDSEEDLYEDFKAALAFTDIKQVYPPVHSEDLDAYLSKINQQEQPVKEDHVTVLYFNGGKEKKLRAFDFVGAITALDGITFDDVGVITVNKRHTTVEILNNKGQAVLELMRRTPVKKKLLKVHVDREIRG